MYQITYLQIFALAAFYSKKECRVSDFPDQTISL